MPRRRKDAMTSVGRGFSHLHHRPIVTKEKPQQRNAANARERARMRVLSRAFCRLKTTLPWVPADTKLSKLDTLRLATTYIGHLRTVLVEGGTSSGKTSPLPSHPVMSWPFMFNKSGTGPSNTSMSDLDSPSSTVDQFSLHNCAAEDQQQHNQHQHHSLQGNIRGDLQLDSTYQISRHQQQDISYCNMGLTTDELNYCGNLPEL